LLSVSQIEKNKVQDFLKYCIWEESEKAKLMLPANENNCWYIGILNAERHFRDGQIGFLLRFCKESDGSYLYSAFEKYFALSKALLDGEKKLSRPIEAEVFEKALLCMTEKSTERHCYLTKQSNSSSSWKFLCGDLSGYLSNTTSIKKQFLFKALLDKLSTPESVRSDMINLIHSFDETKIDSLHNWIVPFIKKDLFSVKMGYFTFSNCVSLSGNDVLLLTTTTERGYSMEINTFLLYEQLKHRGLKNLILNLDTTYAMLDEMGFPKRYIKYGGYKIGYLASSEEKYVVKQADVVKEYDLYQLLNFVLSI
jgi:hypothetical protein